MKNICINDNKKRDFGQSTCYNEAKRKEKEKVSILATLSMDNLIFIASDSHGTFCNNETDREYKKLFQFKNGVFGIIGGNSITIGDENLNIGNYIFSFIKDEQTEASFENIISNIQSEYGEQYGNTFVEVILILQSDKKLINCHYKFNAYNFVKNKNIKVPVGQLQWYGARASFFEKGDSEFQREIQKDITSTLKRFISLNSDIELFINNTRYIGGPIQMYKIPLEGEIKNLSEPPFNKD